MSDNTDPQFAEEEGIHAFAERRLLVALARQLKEFRQASRTFLRASYSGTYASRHSGTYASRRIGGVTFALMPPLHALPDVVQMEQRQVRAAVAQLETRLARAPSARDLAAHLGWTILELYNRMVAAGAGGLRAGDPPIEELEKATASSARTMAPASAPAAAAFERDKLRDGGARHRTHPAPASTGAHPQPATRHAPQELRR